VARSISTLWAWRPAFPRRKYVFTLTCEPNALDNGAALVTGEPINHLLVGVFAAHRGE